MPPQVLSEEGKLLSDLYLNLSLVHPHALLFRVGDSFALIVNSSDFEHLGYLPVVGLSSLRGFWDLPFIPS